MQQETRTIVWFDEVTKVDIPLVGGKGANLGEMVHAQIPVPPGFIVTASAYFKFLNGAGLTDGVRHDLEGLNVNDSRRLQEVSKVIKDKISSASIPPDMVKEMKDAYRKLGQGLVAVRSSATAEDLPEASFAGQQSTFLNVQGEDEVVAAIQGCWSSLFEPRAIFYREEHGFDHLKVGIAVPVQKMIQSEASGVLFTVEPLSSDTTKILIEAIFGLGEAIVSGDVTPDQYLLDKKEIRIIDKKVHKQEWQLVKNASAPSGDLEANIKVPVPPSKQSRQKLADKDIIALSKLGKMIEDLYQFPQDIEWAKQGTQLFILQTRPVTTLKPKESTKILHRIEAQAILTGVAASPGIGVGPVRIVPVASQIDKVKNGDVLVAEMTTPDFVPAMKRASAIVTDRGGRTAHAAIVSRELGIPCVVGTEVATKTLKDGQEITVDGSGGTVYAGKVAEPTKSAPTVIAQERIKTKTRVYVNLAEPELAEAIASRHVDGVGLLRAEFMIAQIGGHPRYMLHEGKGEQFMEMLARGITTFTKAFHPRPVVYRTTDFKTNEYRNLRGGDKYEEFEENPMIGYRGCSRYTREPEVFRLEVETIKKVCQSYDNLYVMIPFVRFVDELARIKRFFVAEGLYQFPNFKLWMMAEVPSNVFLIDKFLDVGIDGISIGSNDLTQLILGIDRDNPKLAPEFDERNDAVLIALEKLVRVSVSKGATASICGQAPSVFPELTEKLVKWGITSVSVSPDMIDETRRIIAAVETKLGQS
ncbi:MAG: phosphoenolpyruvate synthase [Dehalococcoidia bacterium]|nr:phosphoenolpyruvate synthase [Dehalococcoidia bacterium]